MADNEDRRYRDKIGEKAWALLMEIKAEQGDEAARKAARVLDAFIAQKDG